MLLPGVRLFFVCGQVEVDEHGVLIRNPVTAVFIPSFPYECRDVGFYAQLADGLGTYQFCIECRRDGIIIQRTQPKEVVFPAGERLKVFEVPITVDRLRFPANDVYEFHLLCNHKSLATTEMMVYGPTF